MACITTVLENNIDIKALVDGTIEGLKTGRESISGQLPGRLRWTVGWMVSLSHLGMESTEQHLAPRRPTADGDLVFNHTSHTMAMRITIHMDEDTASIEGRVDAQVNRL